MASVEAPDYEVAMILDRPTIEAARASLNARLEYLLAMKCIAARVPGYDTRGDLDDVRFLVGHLGLRTADAVLEIISRYYAPERIAVKTQYFVEEVMQELQSP